MSDRDKLGTHVILDTTPISVQCYDANNCPALSILRTGYPYVHIETRQDGTLLAVCPISKYAEAQQAATIACMGCRARGIR